MDFAIADVSTAVDDSFGGILTRPVLEQIAAACMVQLDRDVSAEWGGNGAVRVIGSPTEALGTDVVAMIVDDLPDAPGAAAYHSLANGRPIIFAARHQFNSLLTGTSSLSCGLSHEFVEAWIDAGCNLWADDGNGNSYAYEGCDATERDFYAIDGVTVSNFVLQPFFIPGAAGPYTYLDRIQGAPWRVSAPFQTAPGGYQIRRAQGGGDTQVDGTLSAAKVQKLYAGIGRTYARGIR